MGHAITIDVELDEETIARLKRLGDVKQRSPHWIMREAILTYLDHEERREREKQEDLERWQRYQETEQHVSHKAVETWLENWGEQR